MPVSPRFNDISVIHYTISHLLEQVSVLEIYPRQTSRAGTKNAGIGIDYDHIGLVLLSCVYGKNASFDIDKYMSQTVISDFEVEDF